MFFLQLTQIEVEGLTLDGLLLEELLLDGRPLVLDELAIIYTHYEKALNPIYNVLIFVDNYKQKQNI
jgi:hypothetical protein